MPSRQTYKMRLISMLAACIASTPVLAQNGDQLIKIGVLAHRGHEETSVRWEPTAKYLSRTIDGYSFIIKPKTLEEMREAAENNLVEFILTNPGNYVDIEANFGATRIATLKVKQRDHAYTLFSAVIFARHDNNEINTLTDLRNKSFMAVNSDAFGGFQMAWMELKQANIDPFRDLADLKFSGFPQDNVVYAVESGQIDAGTVRSDTLERMASEGAISIKSFKILNQKQSDNFPLLHSTRLYPEWPFAKLRQTSDSLAQKVAIALLTMPSDSEAAVVSRSEGWTIPLDYTPVHDVFKTLKIGPYSESEPVTFETVIKQYRNYIFIVFITLLALSGIIIYISRTNRNLNMTQISLRNEIDSRKKAQAELARHRDTLEQNVVKRTQELADLNRELQLDIVARKSAEASLKKSSHTLQTMHEITSSQHMSFEGKIDALLRTGCSCFGLSYGVFSQIKNNRIQIIRFVGEHPGFKRGRWIEPVKHYASNLTQDADPLCILNADTDPRFKAHPANTELHLKSYMGIPIAVSGQLFGFIEYGSTHISKNPFSPLDIDILQLIAQWAGGEIQRQQVQEKAQKHQADLAHVARLGTMGEMASGLAHELNQPLTAIVNYTRGCVRRLTSPNADIKAIVGAMEHSCSEAVRAAEIIRRMRELVNKEMPRRDINDLNDIIEVVIKLVQPNIKKNRIAVKRDLDQELPKVYVDRIQIEQVLINLMNNAIDAMKNTPVHDREIIIQSKKQSNSAIEISVYDRGCGLPSAMQSDVFEPFFSTKNEGMGMGLSISRSIMEAHEGSLNAKSRGLGGSVFSFTLPIGDGVNDD